MMREFSLLRHNNAAPVEKLPKVTHTMEESIPCLMEPRRRK
jgi:hypothetical protein